ncbi:MAG: ribulose 1,5-bisphosphate carboxylase [Alphaproteobacteria bacterium]|nr:MAG: ribulose 1,5-bisphosphate carboxylase [Alphaproteobacteria bacterium]
MSSRLTAIYHVRSDARAIESRAQAIAVEQSVEMPLSAIDDADILNEVVGKVEDIADTGNGLFAVRIGLAAATAGDDPGQLVNMLFGNTSLQDDVTLYDAEFPGALVRGFGGPRCGLAGLRRRTGIKGRAFTCTALKPQGLAPAKLAELAARFARGGIDFIKDDHGLADQAYSPYMARIAAVAAALTVVERETGHRARYVPSITGDLDMLRAQIAAAKNSGVDTVMVQPMIIGLSNFSRLVRENPDVAFFAHPALSGAARIDPALLFGKIFRMLGADAVIFPNHGGRFGYSPQTCRRLAEAARAPWHGREGTIPVPAGGMTTDRVAEMLDFYGAEVMLLIGGALLDAGERLSEETAAFVSKVKDYQYAEGTGQASW